VPASKVQSKVCGLGSIEGGAGPAADAWHFGPQRPRACPRDSFRSRRPSTPRQLLRRGNPPHTDTAEVSAKAHGRSPPSRNLSGDAGAGNAPISYTRSFGRRGHSISSDTHVGDIAHTVTRILLTAADAGHMQVAAVWRGTLCQSSDAVVRAQASPRHPPPASAAGFPVHPGARRSFYRLAFYDMMSGTRIATNAR